MHTEASMPHLIMLHCSVPGYFHAMQCCARPCHALTPCHAAPYLERSSLLCAHGLQQPQSHVCGFQEVCQIAEGGDRKGNEERRKRERANGMAHGGNGRPVWQGTDLECQRRQTCQVMEETRHERRGILLCHKPHSFIKSNWQMNQSRLSNSLVAACF